MRVDEADGRWDDGLRAVQSGLELLVRSKGSGSVLQASYENLQGVLLEDVGRLDEALATYRRCAEMLVRAYGPEHRELVGSYENQADLLRLLGRDEEAVALSRAAVALIRRRGETPTSYDSTELASSLREVGAAGEALELDRQSVRDDASDLSLAFEGFEPRIAGHMDQPASEDLDALTFLRGSDSGKVWGKSVHLPTNHGAQVTNFTSALAVDELGHAAVASNITGGVGGRASCGENPYVATSSDADGGPWTACGADTTSVHGYSSYSVSAAYGASRLKGTLAVTFVNGNANPSDAGADQEGIIYWQHP